MIAETLLAKLEGVVHRGGNNWYARCPAHDDKSPSLSVREVEGKVLVHCFTGCSADEILSACGLGWKDLYPDDWRAAQRRATANGGAKFERRLKLDPMELERWVLKIAAADIRNGIALSVEDRARVQVARMRLALAKETT